MDAILHVVRCFESVPGGEDVIHVEGSVDPIRDIETIETELMLADLQSVEAALPEGRARGEERRQGGDRSGRRCSGSSLPILSEGKPARTLSAR